MDTSPQQGKLDRLFPINLERSKEESSAIIGHVAEKGSKQDFLSRYSLKLAGDGLCAKCGDSVNCFRAKQKVHS